MLVLENILNIRDPILIRFASPIVSHLGTLLSAHESRHVPTLRLATLRCVSIACQVLPSAIGRSANNASGCAYLTIRNTHDVLRSLSNLSSQELRSLDEEADLESLGVALLDTCEKLLLFVGPYLPEKARLLLETCVADSLVCLHRGIQSPRISTDRRLKRGQVETLRMSPRLQVSILQLSCAELLSPHNGGYLSGNAALLKSVAQSCLVYPELNTVAARVLLVVNAVLHPTVVLQAHPPIVSSERLALIAENSLSDVIQIQATAAATATVADVTTDEFASMVDEQEATTKKRSLEASHASETNTGSPIKRSVTESVVMVAGNSVSGDVKDTRQQPTTLLKATSSGAYDGLFSTTGNVTGGITGGITGTNSNNEDNDEDFPELI